MNTITRVLDLHDVKTHKKSTFFRITVKGTGIASMLVILFASAFSIVYVKDLNRRLFIQYQTIQGDASEKIVQWGKLLLEQSTWATQSRIQQIAQGQLGMVVPSPKEVVLLTSPVNTVGVR